MPSQRDPRPETGPEPRPAEPAAVEPTRTGRPGSGKAERAAEQAAADLALLRTFGFADPALRRADAPVVSLADASTVPPESTEVGAAQPVRFTVVRRGGAAVEGATMILLDDHGRQTATATSGTRRPG